MKIFSFGRAKRNQEKLQSFEGDESYVCILSVGKLSACRKQLV